MSVERPTDSPTDPARLRELEREIARGSAQTAYAKLADEPDAVVAEVLGRMIPPHALRILEQFRERAARRSSSRSRSRGAASGRSTPAIPTRASAA